MLTLKEELEQWYENYETIKTQIRAAYRFKNKDAALKLRVRLVTTIDMIHRLEKEGNSDTNSRVSASVSRYIKVANNPPVNFKSVHRIWSK